MATYDAVNDSKERNRMLTAQQTFRAATIPTAPISNKASEAPHFQDAASYIDYVMLVGGFSRCPETQVGTCYRLDTAERNHIHSYFSKNTGEDIELTVIDEPAHFSYLTLDLERGAYHYIVDGVCVASAEDDLAAAQSAALYIASAGAGPAQRGGAGGKF